MDRFRLPTETETIAEPSYCLVCDKQLADDEATEFMTCDGCGARGCSHSIKAYDDQKYQYQQNYCDECKAKNAKDIY